MHPNARLIEKLYSALRDGDPGAAAPSYTDDAHFQDMAFSLDGRESTKRTTKRGHNAYVIGTTKRGHNAYVIVHVMRRTTKRGHNAYVIVHVMRRSAIFPWRTSTTS
jgi:hypothetical protein